MLIYDCEIKKAICGRNEVPLEGIEYCKGWQDHANMGISVICAYDYREDRYRTFCDDNMAAFRELTEKRDVIVGFNSIGFDGKLCAANGIEIPETKCYDILAELWEAAGLERVFRYPTHVGFGLDAVCEANFGKKKTGHGALAPVQWQRGEIGAVIDYCLADVWLTKQVLDKIIRCGEITDPRDGKSVLKVRRPGGANHES